MPIAIGQELESDFRNPLGLLSDCHRRIERFLNALITISQEARGNALDEPRREHLEVALRYFREAAPKHTLDEEESLFPRLQAHDNRETERAFAILEKLHSEHLEADTLHREVDKLGRAWLTAGSLSSADTELLISLLKKLRLNYEKHISVEDTELFPLAGKTLDRAELEAIAREMAARRGLDVIGNR